MTFCENANVYSRDNDQTEVWNVFETALYTDNTRTHKLFNLEHQEGMADVVIAKERFLFFPKSQRQDELYRLFEEKGVLQFPRVDTRLLDASVDVRYVPSGTRPVSELVHGQQSDGAMAFSINSLFYFLGETLRSVKDATGELPSAFSLKQAAYIKLGKGYVCLTPPYHLDDGIGFDDIKATVEAETSLIFGDVRPVKSLERGYGQAG